MAYFMKRVYVRLRKPFFAKRFQSFHTSSGIGENGCGKKCKIIGAQYITVGKNTSIGEGSSLLAVDRHFQQELTPRLIIGNHVRATQNLRLTFAGNITIEDDVLIAPDVFITDHNHGMDPEITGGYSSQPLIVKDVTIGEGSWLGQRVCILPGVRVGKHSIVGAGSIVTHDIPDYCMAVGNPAKVIKKWNAEQKVWEKAYL